MTPKIAVIAPLTSFNAYRFGSFKSSITLNSPSYSRLNK
jgi:hypothetical protein